MPKWAPLLPSPGVVRALTWPGSARGPRELWLCPGQLLSRPEQMAVNQGVGDGVLSSFWKYRR